VMLARFGSRWFGALSCVSPLMYEKSETIAQLHTV
jgi:hypothetical protein